MKILFITHYGGLHGANLSLLQLITDLRKRYTISPLVLIPSRGRLTELLDQESIPYKVIKFRLWQWQIKGSITKNRIINYILNKISLLKIYLELKNENIQIIHTNTSITPIGAYLAEMIGAPHIWHIREFGKDHFNMDYIYGRGYLEKWYNKATVIIPISKAIQNYINQFINDKTKIRLVYNGIDYSIFKPALKKKLSDITVTFIFCGYNSEGKNQLELLEAVKILVERGISDVKIIIVGGYSLIEGYRIRLVDYVNQNDLGKIVTFLDYTNDISELYNEADVGVLCSKQEGFGRVVVEYMYHKLPVIVSNSGALPELVEPYVNGLIYELGNKNDLADKMQWVIENKSDAIKMGTTGQQIAIDKYQQVRVTDEIYSLIRQSIQKFKKELF